MLPKTTPSAPKLSVIEPDPAAAAEGTNGRSGCGWATSMLPPANVSPVSCHAATSEPPTAPCKPFIFWGESEILRTEPDPTMPEPSGSDGPSTSPGPRMPPDRGVVVISTPDSDVDGPIGAISGLRLGTHGNKLHSHEWITIRFNAAESEQPLHRYEVRVSPTPIEDEDGFIREGRPAKTASLDPEGAVSLMLPLFAAMSTVVDSDIAPASSGRIAWSAASGVPRRTGLISMWLTPTSD